MPAVVFTAQKTFYIFESSILERLKGFGNFVYVFFREITMLAVYHITHLASIDEDRLPFLLFVLTNKPKGDWYCNAVEELCRQCDYALHQIVIDDVLSYFSLSA